MRLGRLHPLTRLTSLALGGLPLLGDAAVSGEEEEEVEGKAGARAGSPSAAGCGDADEDGGSAAGGLCALGAAPLARLSLWGTRVGSPGLELLLGCAWPQLRELDLSWAAEVDVVPALPALRVGGWLGSGVRGVRTGPCVSGCIAHCLRCRWSQRKMSALCVCVHIYMWGRECMGPQE